MAVLWVVVVARSVKVGGHGADVIATVLRPVSIAHVDACDLGDGVGGVGGLELSGQQRLLSNGLGGVLGVDA